MGISVAIYINKKNTHVAIKEDNLEYEVIDLSYGYGKFYSNSSIIYNGEFLFLNDTIDIDIYDDSLVFESIFDIIDNDIFINNCDKNDILKLFLESILKYISEVTDEPISRVIVSFESIQKYEQDFIRALNELSIKDVQFIMPSEALIIHGTENVDSSNILFFDYEKTYSLFVQKNDNTYFVDKREEKVFSIELFIEYLYNRFVEFFISESNHEKVMIEDDYNIRKLVFDSLNNILDKYYEKSNSQIVFGFCFPALILDIKYEEIEDFLKNTLFKIDIESPSIYSECIDSKYLKQQFKSQNTLSVLSGMFSSINNEIKFSYDKKSIFEYGFLVNNDKFINILSENEPIKETNFLIKNKNSEIVLYKKTDNQVLSIIELNIDKLDIDMDFCKISSKCYFKDNKIFLELKNNGFLYKSNDNEICFEIEV